jgi:hypothetical protein
VVIQKQHILSVTPYLETLLGAPFQQLLVGAPDVP